MLLFLLLLLLVIAVAPFFPSTAAACIAADEMGRKKKKKEEDSDDVDDISWGSGLPIDSSREDDRGSPSGFGGGESEITGIEDTGDMEVGEYATSSEDSF